MPLDDRGVELFAAPPRPGSPHDRKQYVYYPPLSHLPADVSPPVGGRTWTMEVDVTVAEGGCKGVLYARGGHNGGHSFFLRDGSLIFDYNALGTHYRASGSVKLGPGEHTLGARFERAGPGGTITIAANGRDVGSIELPRVLRMISSTGTDFGADTLSPVVDDYDAPFAFSGQLRRVVFEILGRPDARDVVVTARTEMAKE